MTAQRYRLPEALGGREVELLTDQEPTRNVGDYVWVRDPDLGVIQMPMSKLTPVPPPIPEEPEPGAYEIGGRTAVRWKLDHSCCWAYDDVNGSYVTSAWGALWDEIGGPDVTIRRLVPEPPVERVTLPWSGESQYGAKITVERFQDGPNDKDYARVRIQKAETACSKSHDWLLPLPVARSMAAALLSVDGA